MVPALVIGAVIGVIILIGVVAWKLDKKRTEDFAESAAAMGLEFSPTETDEVSQFRSTFKVFDRGRRRKVKNVTYGVSNGTGVWVFDYQYTTGSGKHSHTYNQTIACFRDPDLTIPAFSLEAEGMLAKLGNSLFKTQDIDFDSHPEFSKKFLLRGDNEQQIRNFFNPQVLDFFEQQDKKIRVEGRGPLLIVYRTSRTIKAEGLDKFLKEGFSVFSALRTT